MKPIITISGNGGSGKSTIAQALIKKYKAQHIYVGAVRRQLALDMGMTLHELNEYGLTHPETDVDVDKAAAKKIRELAKKSMVIAEGRTQFYFIPESIKLFIKVDQKEGAKRVWKEMQQAEAKKKRNEADVSSYEELLVKMSQREEADRARYKKYYNLDHTDESQYDFILDTTNINAQTAIQKVIDFIDKSLK